MSAKNYLSQIYILQGRISRLQHLRAQIREDIYSVSSPALDKDIVNTSITSGIMERLIAKVDSVERDIVSEMRRLVSQREIIRKQIESLQDERHRMVLYQRYVACRKWEQIALDMNYSERNVFVLHGEALKAFETAFADVCSEFQ